MTRRHHKILHIGKQLFVEKGYTETSMRDLAGKLNIKEASLYNRFKSKEEILAIILWMSVSALKISAMKFRKQASNQRLALNYLFVDILLKF